MTTNVPLPDLDDPLTQPFWAAAHQGRLVMPRCTSCGYLQWPPERLCPECQSRERSWGEFPALGTLWSYAVYHRALDPAFADRVPYVVGLVEVDGTARKMYGFMTTTEDEVAIGGRVRGVFVRETPDITFIQWQMDPERPAAVPPDRDQQQR